MGPVVATPLADAFGWSVAFVLVIAMFVVEVGMMAANVVLDAGN